MNDPFEILFLPADAVAPDGRFAARLRARVAAALAGEPADLPTIELPERKATTMTSTDPDPGPAVPAPIAAIVPYICIRSAADALAWYGTVFEAVETVRYTGDDGRIGHAEMTIGGARLMLSDEYPEIGVTAPTPLGGISFTLNLNVADVDAVYARAVDAGAASQYAPHDEPYGDRSATIIDPFGHRWMVQTTIAAPTVEEIGDAITGYTITVPGAEGTATASAPAEPDEQPAKGD